MNKKCIYCMRSEPMTVFQGREHIVSKTLWVFNNIERLPEEIVCKECNSFFSNNLENKFKETSYEGYFSYMIDLKNKWKIEIDKDFLDMKTDFWFENDFFNKTFPILNEEWKIIFTPQIIIEKWNKLYIYLYDTLKITYDNKDKSKNQNDKFNRMKDIIISVPNNCISVFWDENTHDLWIELLKLYKDDFKVTKVERESTEHLRKEWVEVRVKWKIRIKEENLRLVMKIMFNYFSYCAIKSSNGDILYKDNFDRIRNLILWKEKISLWNDIKFSKQRIMENEESWKKFYLGHQIIFEVIWDNIVWKIILFWINVYEIILWSKIWIVDKDILFGCGHFFNIPNETVHSLCKNQALKWLDNIDLWFWLYNNWF